MLCLPALIALVFALSFLCPFQSTGARWQEPRTVYVSPRCQYYDRCNGSIMIESWSNWVMFSWSSTFVPKRESWQIQVFNPGGGLQKTMFLSVRLQKTMFLSVTPLDWKLESQGSTFFLEMSCAFSKWPYGDVMTSHDFGLVTLIQRATNGIRDWGSAKLMTSHDLVIPEIIQRAQLLASRIMG